MLLNIVTEHHGTKNVKIFLSPNTSRLNFTADRGGAVSTFLGKQVAEAVEAVGKVVPGGEALAGQLLLAADADEALLMPGLVTVVHSSGGDGLKDAASSCMIRLDILYLSH